MVLRQSGRLVGLGVILGLLAAFLLTRTMSSLLFGIRATDPISYVVVSLILGLVALLASYIPAYRATKVDPIEALRYE
jgi:ABC-type antimicrobial peptide transport system permease subunit